MFDLLDSFNFCGGVGDAAPTTPQKSFPEPETDPEMAGVNYSTAEPAKSFTPTVDPMNANNYLVVQLTRPMGILFEENLDYQHTIGGAIAAYGGAVIAEVNEGYAAAEEGLICRGDQLVGIGKKRVSGMDFDDVMKVIEGSGRKITLTVFRGPAEALYGPWASVDWQDAFVAERGEEAALYEDQVDSESEAWPADEAGAARKDLLGVISHIVTALDEDSVAESEKADMFYDIAAAVLDASGEKGKTVETFVRDLESHVMEPFAAEVEDVVVVENEVEEVESGGSVGRLLDFDKNDDVFGSHYENTASQAISTALADVARKEIGSGKSLVENSLPLGKEPMKVEASLGTADVNKLSDEKKEVVGTDDAAAVVVADESVTNVGVTGESTQESDDPMPNAEVNDADEPTVSDDLDLEKPKESPTLALFDDSADGDAVVIAKDEADVDKKVSGEGVSEADLVPDGSFTDAIKTKGLLENPDAYGDSVVVSDDELNETFD